MFSQRSPRASALLGGVRLSAPHGLRRQHWLTFRRAPAPLCSFEDGESVLKILPSLSKRGHCLPTGRDGSTRCADERGLVFHLKQEWTPFVLSNAADVRARTFCASCSIRTKNRCPFCPHCKGAGGRGSLLHAERLAPDTLVQALSQAVPCSTPSALPPAMRRAADGAGRLHPDARPCPSGGEEHCACGCAPELRLAANRMTLTDHDARCSGRAFVWHGALCGNFCVKSL